MIFTVLLSLVSLALITLFFLRKRKVTQTKRAFFECIEQLEALKSLLIKIQKHRGLSTGFLNGDHYLEENTKAVCFEIDKTWNDLSDQFPSLNNDALYIGIHTHWDRLKRLWMKQEIDNNIEQHNRLILNLLYLIENQTEANSTLVRYGRATGQDIVWKELLESIETIGQTRAIGIGIIASGKSNSVERIRLTFLTEKIAKHLTELNSTFTLLCPSTGHTISESPQFNKAVKNTNDLTEFIETYLLNKKISNLSSSEFFALASASIKPLDELFSHSIETLKKHADV